MAPWEIAEGLRRDVPAAQASPAARRRRPRCPGKVLGRIVGGTPAAGWLRGGWSQWLALEVPTCSCQLPMTALDGS